MKSVEENNNLREKISQLFDNPLKWEFLTFEQVVDFFGYSKKWVRQQMAEGYLPYHCYGKSGFLFYIPELRQAILSDQLAPIRRKNKNDKRHQNKKWNQISSESASERAKTLQDIRNEKRCGEMGELHSFS